MRHIIGIIGGVLVGAIIFPLLTTMVYLTIKTVGDWAMSTPYPLITLTAIIGGSFGPYLYMLYDIIKSAKTNKEE